MNKLKNILSFFLQLLVLPIAAYLLFSLWMEQELGKIFYQNACFLFMLCYAIPPAGKNYSSSSKNSQLSKRRACLKAW